MISIAAGNIRAAMMSLTVCARGLDGIECGQQRLHHFRTLDDAQSDLRRHTERALRTDEHAGQIVAGRIQGRRAQLDQFAGREARRRGQERA